MNGYPQHFDFGFTDEQREAIRVAIVNMRKIAEPVGPLHGLWDCISGLDLALQNKAFFFKDEPLPNKDMALRWADEYAMAGSS